MSFRSRRNSRSQSELTQKARRRQLERAKRRQLLLEPLERRELLIGEGVAEDAERLVVRFHPGVSDLLAEQWARENAVQIVNRLQNVFNGAVVALPAGRNPDQAKQQLEQSPLVAYAERNTTGQYLQTFPNDPRFAQQWALHNTGQTGGRADADIDAPEAWELLRDSSSVVIAIVDSGTNYNHPDLAPVMWRNPGETPGDGIDNDGNGYIDDVFGINAATGTGDPMDLVGHGTHVSGIAAAAGNNGVGIAGVNWNAQLMALSIGTPNPTSAGAIAALDYMVRMKRVYNINLVASNHSYGIGASQAFQDAIQASIDAGIVFVAAAGNSSLNIDTNPTFPASYPNNGIITVAATDHNDVIAGFSNRGAVSVDLGAPGVGILSTMLTSGLISDPSGFGISQGTSMAAPFVAGAAALLAARNPDASVADIKAALLSTVDPVPSLAGVTVTGGRLNLFQALQAIGLPATRTSAVPMGPRLVGVQPQSDDLFSLRNPSQNVRDVAPRQLTLRFDEDQQIDPQTLAGIRIIRSGDGIFGNGDDQTIVPGFIGVSAAPDENEVVIRFAETLPDDLYRVEILGIGSASPLRNRRGEAFVPTLNDGDGDNTKDTVSFELDLGPQVVAVVPQPVSRNAAGAIVQARNQIQVFFNNDDLFVERDSAGNPTPRSAEHPDFYQLIFTADTVRNTDDAIVKPVTVVYDPLRNLATLTFAQDLDRLLHPDTGAVIGPGTFRLRIGTNEAAPLPPQRLTPHVQASSDFNTNNDVVIQFTAVTPDEQDVMVFVTRNDLGPRPSGPAVRVNVVANAVLLDLNSRSGHEATAAEIVAAVNNHPAASRLVVASINQGSGSALVGNREVNYSPIVLTGMGSSFDTATNLADDTDLGAVLVVNGAGIAFIDGESFSITDAAGQARTFEFDVNEPPVVNDNTAVRIPFRTRMSQAEMANAIVLAINSASFGVRATLAGNRIRLEGERFVDLGSGVAGLEEDFQNRFDNGQILEVVRGGDAFRGDDVNPDRFRITNAAGVTQVFEFDSGFILQVPASGAQIADAQKITISFNNPAGPAVSVVFEFEDSALLDGLSDANAVPILFAAADSQSALTSKILTAIKSKVDDGTLVGISPLDLGGGRIHLGGTVAHSVTTPGGTSVTQSGTPGPQMPGAVAIPFVPHPSFTAVDVAKAIGRAVNAAPFGVAATVVGVRVSLHGDRSTEGIDSLTGLRRAIQERFDAGPVLVITNDPSNAAAFPDGAKFQIRDDRGITHVFEIDRNGAASGPNVRVVSVTGSETRAELAQKIANAINAAPFRVQATALHERIYLTNDRSVNIETSLRGLITTSQGLIISSQISPRPFLLDFPGNEDEPGHRNIPDEVGRGIQQHINESFGVNGRDGTPGVTTILYNFKSDFAVDPQGNPLENAITEGQKQRARDAFALWSRHLGVQFVESAREGLTIATGDLRALSPTAADVLSVPANNFRVRIDPTFSIGMLVMDSAQQWSDNFGGNWFVNAMIGIGSMLGLDRADDLPRTTLMAYASNVRYPNEPTPEPIFLGNADILHGQHLYRPDGVDVDLYRFTIDIDSGRTGVFTAETFAERLPSASLLDTVLSLYRENPDGTRELIARNDDYFSRDSYIEMPLGAGVYYIGVSARGNTDFDPTIDNTGLGGTSQGKYDLRLNFRSQVDSEDAIRDRDGRPTLLDGDADGVPGGVYNFWFQTRPLNRILTMTGGGSVFQDGQILTLTNNQGVVRRFEFDSNGTIQSGNVRVAFTAATTPAQMAQALAAAISGTAGFGVTASAAGSDVILGDPLTQAGSERSVQLSFGFTGIDVQGRTIFVDKLAGPNSDGSLARPFNNIARSGVTNAFSVARPNDIVRIVGNGGSDGNINTLGDNFAYEVGFGTLPGQVLSDGTEMAVPQGTTVMIEPGTIFKMRRSRLGVGSSSLTVDRSGGAVQVLGTPELRVIFTSWLDETIGRDTHLPTTMPGRGDWGGISIRADIDNQQARPNRESQGIFLNYINHTDVLYGGGGNVVIDGIQQIVNPIQMLQTRPTITFNRIMHSADSAMSATPNSFDETNFHAPRFQAGGEFTSDYDRVGPHIRGNFLIHNSNNGLFIRIQTPAGNTLETLRVSGRFDDTDIVHLLSENLVVEGSEGVPFLDLSRPEVQLVTFSRVNGGGLPAGNYAYKITFVDANGFEGRPSLPTSTFSISAANVASGARSIRLNQLPPGDSSTVSRRIYRTSDPDPSNATYVLVGEINALDSTFLDLGQSLGSVLQRDPPPSTGVTLTVQPRGSLAAGVYNYRIVYVDALGREGAASDPITGGNAVGITIPGATAGGGILLGNLPAASGAFVARRIYRSRAGGISPYELVAEIDATSSTYFDDGFTKGGQLDPSTFGVVRARPHARLAIDPGTVLKMEGSRIETRFGGQLIFEGLNGQEVIITSRRDDSYGAGGTFDTNDDDQRGASENVPLPGDWGGLYVGPLGSLSLDHALVAFGGGQNRIEGTTKNFNVIELHQADARITNSVIQNNANGIGGQGPLDRFGRGFNLPSTIFVRGSQPIIVNNIIRDNVNPPPGSFDPANGLGARDNAAITINLNSLTSQLVADIGRSRGAIDRVVGYSDNRGPLIRQNRLDNNGLNGLVVRGEVLTTQSVWDDTDIVHVLTNRYDDARFGWLFDEVVIPNVHTFGGLRLQSSANESLVVKLEGRGNIGQLYNLNPTNGAGFTATGQQLEIEDRIGGILHVIGQPGFPVVLTSIHDDTVGAGIRPNDLPQVDTNNNGIATRPSPGDWRGLRLDQNSHDRNVEIITELEPANETAPGRNATTDTAEFLGRLAPDEKSGDNISRMGFEVHGLLNEPGDIDIYSFEATAGTEVWVDIDRTTFSLDTVIELLDANGNVLARSKNTLAESNGVDFIDPSLPRQLANPLQRSPDPYYPTHVSGLPRDHYSTNPRDAGMRVSLPGSVGNLSTYHFRVRSEKGLTSGVYQFQVRTRERDEFPGSAIRFADIRYAQNGIEVLGHPRHSPLLGEAAEDEELDSLRASNNNFVVDLQNPGRRPQQLGNLFGSDRGVFSIGGSLASATDVDFYTFDVDYEALSAQSLHYGSLVFDLDYADGLNRANSTLAVFNSQGQLIFVGRDSNIAEDRPGPNAGSDLTDLSRGSVGAGDPFIGPVHVLEGQYFVAVMPVSRIPSELLSNELVRLEPVNSVVRIAEDRIGSSGGSTASAPVVPVLLDPTFVGTGPNRWHVTTQRGFDPGHGITATFDRSRTAVPGGNSFFFGSTLTGSVPAGSTGNLLSNPFSLQGYSAADLPVLYFNYFVDNDPTADAFRVSIVNAAGTATRIASSNTLEAFNPAVTQLAQTGGGSWRQARLDLGAFAGQSNLRLRFEYNTTLGGGEGAYVDDIIIGFAERGEMVTGATINADIVANPATPTGQILTGDYQLEIRKASPYGTANDATNRLVLHHSIDTNDRLAQQTTLIAPSGSQVIEGQQFTISDGVNSVTFEYEDPLIGNGVSQAGLVEIRFRTPDATAPGGFRLSTDFEIAARIRDAINSPQVASRLKVRAALSDGTASGTASRDNRVNLFGGAIVEQPPAFGITQVTTDANQLRDVILGQGLLASGNAAFTGGGTSAGLFQGGRSLLGMESGIVLSTGDVRVAAQPNTNDASSGRASGSGDRRLDAAFGVTTTDASILEFDFRLADPTRNDIVLNFVFASEDYNERVGTIGDVLAVFVDGVDITNNIAVVPVLGVNRPVSINTIHSGNPFNPSGATGVNAALFRNNDPSNNGAFLDQFGYDGFTAVLTARLLDLDPNVTHKIVIAIADVDGNPADGITDRAGDSAIFIQADSFIAYDHAATPNTRYVEPPQGIASIRHQGYGDQNVFRDQGQVIIHSNTITKSADFGIVTRSGDRDAVSNATFESSVPVKRLQSNMGPTRRLRDLNDLGGAGLTGGFAPGVVIVNNTIAGEGLGGIHVAGNLPPLELTIWQDRFQSDGTANASAGDHFCDGDTFSLTVGRQTVVFEFEDLRVPTGNAAFPCPRGDGVGWTPGRVPVFYERTIGTDPGYTELEMALAIKEAIDNSPLVENQTTFVSQVYIADSRAVGQTPTAGPGFARANVALYIEHVDHFSEFTPNISTMFQSQRFLPVAYAAQPFVQVVNNTIYGGDGTQSFFPQAAVEPNDTLQTAIKTLQGRAHNPEVYTTVARLGDTQHFRDDRSKDVDFYEFHMDIGDRVTVNINTGNTLDTVLRLFNSEGQELLLADNGPIDPTIDFRATVGGTYYVAVSGAGNDRYSPTSLADRRSSTILIPPAPQLPPSYTITINVQAPRKFLIDMEDLLGGAQFQITDLNGTVTINAGAAANTAVAARNLVAQINNSGLLQGVTASTIGSRTWNYIIQQPGNPQEYERYVVVNGAVKITGPATELIPTINDNQDQLLRETGILITEAATPTLVNNVLSNLRNGVVETAAFRTNNDRFSHLSGPQHPLFGATLHPLTAVKTGQIFQHNQFGNMGVSIPWDHNGVGPFFRVDSQQLIESIERYDALIDTTDFNIVLPPNAPLFVNAASGNFYPARLSQAIDSSIDSLQERQQFQLIKTSAGIALSPILAPDRDGSGQLRVDDQEVDTPQGQGSNVFKDRGALDRADFVGPAAQLVNPQDNDARGKDLDAAVSVVQLASGVFADFRIQIVDGFESADPFPGIGVDDSTLIGRTVQITEEGLRLTVEGPVVTLFQDGVFLREGIDYTYRYNQTSNTIVLAPLAGIWPDDKVYVIRINNRDRFVIDATSGAALADGDRFTITNDVGDTATFEFDNGFTVLLTPTLGLRIPAIGAGAGGILDGQQFTIDDGSRAVNDPVVFEFDENANWLPGNRRVAIPANATADQIADALVAALSVAHLPAVDNQGQPLPTQPHRLTVPLQPRNLGNGLVHVGATQAHRVGVGSSAMTTNITQLVTSLTVPAGGGAAIQDNESFVVSNGTTTITFELSNNGLNSTIPGSVVIPFLPGDTADAIAGVIAGFLTNPRNNGNELGLGAVPAGNGIVRLQTAANHTFDMSRTALTRQVLVGGVTDGEVVTLRQNANVATIEFDNNGNFGTGPANTVISFTPADTHLELAERLTAAIANARLGLDPVNAGNGEINIGGEPGIHQVTLSQPSSMRLVGAPGVSPSTTLVLPSLPGLEVDGAGGNAFVDGDTFTISNGVSTATFEFDNDGRFVDLDNNNQPDFAVIQFFNGQTASSLANAILGAIATENGRLALGLSPTLVGSTVIGLGAPATVTLFTNGLHTANLLGNLTDGETFTIDNGSRVALFEFEDIQNAPGLTRPGSIPITFRPGSFVQVVAESLRAALIGANIGVNPTIPQPGTGRVELGDTTRHLTNVSNSSLTLEGVPGGAARIKFRTNFTEAGVAEAIVDGINSARTKFDGVSARLRGGSTVFVDIAKASGEPANFISGFAAIAGIDNFFLSAVKDIAGNPLKANQATGETVFTILLPGVELDFGDAPDPFAGAGRYPTLFASDGARHVITDNPLFLGSGVDADRDGQPSLAADGDDADHQIDLGSTNLRLSGLAPFTLVVPAAGGAAIADGETFTIRRGGLPPVTFEFNSVGPNPANPIPFSAADTADVIANKIVAAIQSRIGALHLRPVNLGNGRVFVGANPGLSIGVSAGGLTLTNEPLRQLVLPLRLVVPANGAADIVDDELISMSDGAGTTARFEFDKNGSGLTTGTHRIGLTGSETQAQVAALLVNAMLSVFPTLSITQANGVIEVRGISPGHTLGAQAGSQFAVNRVPTDGATFVIDDGVHPAVTFEINTDGAPVAAGSIAVNMAPNATDVQATDAILAAVVAQQANLNGLAPRKFNAHTVTLAFVENDALDLSSSSLTHDTRLPVAIHAPGVGVGGTADGQSFTLSDGTRSVTFEFDLNGTFTEGLTPIVLSAGATADAVGAAIAAAINNSGLDLRVADLGGGVLNLDVADEDGVRFDGILTPGRSTPITVTASDVGRLDAWMDYNQDGDWDDPGEQIFVSVRLQPGANSLAINVPSVQPGSGLPLGDTYARFRFSRAGSLQPHGLAVDGEVEDYKVRIITNDAPFVILPGIPTVVANEDDADRFVDLLNVDGLGRDAFGDVDLTNGNGDRLTYSVGIYVLDVVQPGSSLQDGGTITVNGSNGSSTTFEFDSDNFVVGTNIRVPFTTTSTASAIAAALAQLIETQAPGVTASIDAVNSNRIRLTGERSVLIASGFSGLVISNNTALVIPSLEIDGRTIRLDFQLDQNGTTNVNVRATDHGGLFREQTFQVTVNPINDPPTALGVEGVQVVTVPANCQPTFTADIVNTCEDHVIRIDLAGDDGDPLPHENQVLTFRIIDASNARGTLSTPDANGVVTYTPQHNYHGPATFVYVVEDDASAGPVAQLVSAPRTVTLSISSINDPPSGISETFTTQEDTPVTFTLRGDDDGDPNTSEGQNLSFRIVTFPQTGTFTSGVNLATGAVTGPITYLPGLNFNNDWPNAPVVFTFRVTDDGVPPESSSPGTDGTITISITPVNDPPIPAIVNVSAPAPCVASFTGQVVVTCEDSPTLLTLGGDDGDPETTQTLSFQIANPPLPGTGTLSPIAPNGQVTYTPPPGFSGSAQFEVDVTDSGTPALTTRLTVQVTVQPVNDPPIADNQAVSTNEDTPLGITLTADDGDPVPQVLTFFVLTFPTHGTLSGVNPTTGVVTGPIIYTPNLNYHGTDSFTFQVEDDAAAGNPPNLRSNIATVAITIIPVNDPPVPHNQTVATNEDTPLLITLTGDDGDPLNVPADIQSLTFEIFTPPANGVVSGLNPNTGAVTYTPGANYNGPDSFTFRVRDNGTNPNNLASLTLGTVSINVAAINDPPEFTAGPNVTVNEDAGSQTLANWATGIRPGPASAIDEANQVVTFNVTNNNNALFLSTGQPALSNDGTLRFTPAPNANGQAEVLIRAIDNGNGVAPHVNVSAIQTVTITITPVNDPPQFFRGVNQTVNEDAPLQTVLNWATNILPGPVTAVDEFGQTLTFDVTFTATGNLAFSQPPTIDATTGTLTYQPAPNTNGAATVTVRLRDNGSSIPPNVNTSAPETFTITVNPINDAPEFTAGPNVTADEDAGLVRLPGWATNMRAGPPAATDEVGQVLTFVTNVISTTGGLTFQQAPQVNATSGELSFQTSANRHGTAIVAVSLRDNGPGIAPHVNQSAAQTFTITVNAVNDPPEFTLGANPRVAEDSGPANVSGFVTGIRPGPITADDEAGQTVTFTTTNDRNDLFVVQPTVSAVGTLTFTPAPNANGVAVVTVQAQDSGSGVPPNQNTTIKQFTITIDPVNDPPTLALPNAQVVNEDQSLAIPPITVNDLDAAEGTGEVSVELRVLNGTLTVNTSVPGGVTASEVVGNGTSVALIRAPLGRVQATLSRLNAQNNPDGVSYRGNLNFHGQDRVTVTVNDLGNHGSPGALQVVGTIPISVLSVNDPPFVANPIQNITVDEDAPNTLVELFPQVFNDPDIATDNDRLTYRVVTNTNPALVTTSISGSVLTLALVADAFGQAEITIEARDLAGLTAQNTFRLFVNPVNDPPTTVNDSFTVAGNVPTILNVLANDSDKDGTINPATVTIVSAPSNATATVNPNGTVTFTPNPGFAGSTTFTYTVRDDLGATSAPATVTVRVNAPPIARNDEAVTNQGVPVAIAVLGNDSDSDGTLNLASVQITRQGANGTAVPNAQGVVTYTPNPGFSGTDTFRYTVRDELGAVSNEAVVTITVRPFQPWQNPNNRLDVNADGFVSAIDVLLLVNRINTVGPGTLPPPTGTEPPPFYDVNGDGQLSPVDVVQVVNFLNDPGGGGEGESSAPVSRAQVLSVAEGASAVAGLITSFTPGFVEQRYRPFGMLSGSTAAAALQLPTAGDAANALVDGFLASVEQSAMNSEADSSNWFVASAVEELLDELTEASLDPHEITDAALDELLQARPDLS